MKATLSVLSKLGPLTEEEKTLKIDLESVFTRSDRLTSDIPDKILLGPKSDYSKAIDSLLEQETTRQPSPKPSKKIRK